jgi:hypothetical protein
MIDQSLSSLSLLVSTVSEAAFATKQKTAEKIVAQ